MKKIKTAVIGSGFMGAAHIEALSRIGGIEIAALVSKEKEQAENLADRFSIPSVSEDWHDVITDKNIEVIHNCTPNFYHFDINKAAIGNNKHIISEKPLTINTEQSAELLDLLKKHRVVNAINFNYRFYPLIRHIYSVFKQEVGEVYLVHGHYLQDWLFYDTDYNWRLETEVSGESRAVADIGSHWCDLIQYVTGLKIKRVFADLSTIHLVRKKPAVSVETFKGKMAGQSSETSDIKISTEDAGSVLFTLENGAKGVFTVSQVSAGRKNHFWFEIDGSKKAVSWNQENPNELWMGYREKANEILIKDPSLLSAEARKFAHYPGGHPEGYPDGPKNLFMSVYEFIRSGKDPLKDKPDFPTFNDGHHENIIVEAILRSNKEQKWIEV
jgi:predicted dehydrogenase